MMGNISVSPTSIFRNTSITLRLSISFSILIINRLIGSSDPRLFANKKGTEDFLIFVEPT